MTGTSAEFRMDWKGLTTQLEPIGFDKVEPNPAGAARAIGAAGYTLAQAVADLIDNSVDAKASRVLVRFLHDDRAIRRVFIVDDGKGMDDAHLLASMSIGVQSRHKAGDLGMYGIGLKSASFSQCRQLSVVTRQAGTSRGRAWSRDHIDKDGWECGRLGEAACRLILDLDWTPLRMNRSGTIIVWDRLLPRAELIGADAGKLQRMAVRLAFHLGLTFHRLIEDGRLQIHIDARKIGEDVPSAYKEVAALDPFGYPASGSHHYPKEFEIRHDGAIAFKAVAHIWPPLATTVEYKLGGSAASRQGFYFYRNDRLLQAGGWNETRTEESEPHLSLARVAIELPDDVRDFAPNSLKSGVEEPTWFRDALHDARCDNTSWSDYIRDAKAAYGKKAPSQVVLVPGKGFAGAVSKGARRGTPKRGATVRPIQLTWRRFEASSIVAVNRDSDSIEVNSRYRTELTGSRTGSLPATMQALLFFILREDFEKTKASAKRDGRLTALNAMLTEAL